MDELEAGAILRERLAQYELLSYDELVSLVNKEPITLEVSSPSGQWYQIEIQAFWDSGKRGGDIRMLGSIDDGGMRAYRPLYDDFIIRAPMEFP